LSASVVWVQAGGKNQTEKVIYMQKAQKPIIVDALNKTFQESSLVIVTRQNGLTVAQSTDLRNKMRGAQAYFKVTKNTLARIAVKGTPCEQIADHLTGPTAIAAANDPVAVAKVAVDFAKGNDKFEIVGGVLNGKALSKAQIEALSKLPSLDQLRGQLIGLIQAPATKLAGVVQAPAAQLARVFAAYARKDS
jgi:large subunit ribosomal protein L10